jgi:uncharacterized protein YhfF
MREATMIGEKTPEVEAFWQKMREEHNILAADYRVSTFADPRLSQNVDKITDLALSGQKRATAHLEMDFVRNEVPRRAAGDYRVILNAAQKPVALVRVTRVEVLPFDRVSEDTAIAEGEGDLSLDYWRTVHRRYFVKQCEL